MINHLTKRFGPVEAVAGLGFSVEPGAVTGFLGPNGAGKTTTLRILLGLVTPTAGTATIGGRTYVELSRPTRQVGAVLDAAGFHPARSGRDHLRVYCAADGHPDERADEVLELVDLSAAADRRVGDYSTGMRRRLALATALLGDPPVLVLDEPANGLDPQGIAWLRSLLRRLAGEGRTILVSSHVLSEVELMVDRVVVVNRGRLVHAGPLRELADSTAGVVVARSPQADRLAAAVGAKAERVEQTGPDTLRIAGVPATAVGHIAFSESVELHELATERNSLEQAFFAMTADADGPGDAREPTP